MTIIEIREAVEKAWSVETTFLPDEYHKDWNCPHDKALGQCGVTALLVQEIRQGLLMKGMVNGRVHYWNFIDGFDIDLTWRQFPAGSRLTEVQQCFRDEILANAWFKQRYHNLVKNFMDEPNVKADIFTEIPAGAGAD